GVVAAALRCGDGERGLNQRRNGRPSHENHATVSSPRRYFCCCGVAVAPAFRRSRPSTVIRACGAYISSQLCSDQNTSFSGAGLYLFFAELSNSVTTVTLLPAGMWRGAASS